PLSFVTQLAFSTTGEVLAVARIDITSGSIEASVLLIDVATGKQLRTLVGHRSAVRATSFSPDGRYLATAGDDQGICLWDLSTGKQVRSLKNQSGTVQCIRFSPDGRSLASAGGIDRLGNRKPTVYVWELATGQMRCHLVGHQDLVNSLVFTPNGRLLVSGGDD